LLSGLPRYITRLMFVDGLLTGRLVVSDSLRHPQIRGFTHVIDARLLGGASLSTAVTFAGQTATVDFAQFVQKNLRTVPRTHASTAPTYTSRGEIAYRSLTDIEVKLWPN